MKGRRDYGLVLSGKGQKVIIGFVSFAGSGEADAFNAAVADILGAISCLRPDLEVSSGVNAVTAWVIFAASAIPAVLGLLFGLVLIAEPGATGPALGGLAIGAVFAFRAFNHRPWTRREKLPVGELAQMFAGS